MKVLFFNSARYLVIGIPQGIAVLSAILKKAGHEVELFDTTFLKPKRYILDSKKPMAGTTVYKKTPYTLEDLVKDDPGVSIEEEFQKKIDSFKPDLIAVSTMTINYDFAMRLLKRVNRRGCPVIMGGMHATICPEDVIFRDIVDMICVGEGEESLLELCDHMEQGKGFTDIPNLWVKSKNGKIYKNKLRPFVDLDKLPHPDWSIFDQRHLYRPFMGKVYKGSFYTSSRGCPGRCTYCVNDRLGEMFKECGRYFRCQKPETTAMHLTELKKRYGATWFKFGDDTFLLQPLRLLKELRDMIKPLNILFGCSVRPDTITEEKVKVLKEMGCVAMSIGIETGNEEIRKKVLNRNISDSQIEKALKIINDYDIRISTFNLIGLPGEKRENVFETIELNRRLNVKSANVYVVYPYSGTKIASTFNIVTTKKNGEMIPLSEASIFHLSKMSPREVEALKKTFNLYLSLPKELWPLIKIAEGSGAKSNRVYKTLLKRMEKIV